MFNASDAQALRISLPELNLHASVPHSSAMSAYLQHYGLDLASLCPQRTDEIAHSVGAFSSAGYRIACHYFTPSPAMCTGIVILVHGYYDHVGLYSHLIQYCLARNFAVFAFDLPGHGLSSGEPAAIDSFTQYTTVFSECLARARSLKVEQPVHVLAQSTGGAIVMDYCLNHCASSLQDLDNIVLLAPLVQPVAWRRGSVTHALVRRFIKSIRRNFADNSHDAQFLKFLREGDPMQCRRLPVSWVGALKQWLQLFDSYEPCSKAIKVVQGSGDKTVNWRYNLERIKEKFPKSEAVILQQARHHLANESQEIRDALYKELDRFL